ncbi:MAG: pyrimidine dimer DNA glycosylase/endonuclease V [Microgenomates group bacterium]|nr:pyrimidine dimer DNA glycosylase/endonuclease V [Microgenomates group bacterium]
MRIWDIEPKHLCQKHLLGEHRELHGLWNILTIHKGKGGYSRHPETLRWKGKLKALFLRHEKLVKEMEKRNYKHNSPLNKKLAKGKSIQDKFVNTINEQGLILKNKKCQCKI